MGKLTQRKRRRRARESAATSSESDGGSEDDREEEEERERRWQTRRSAQENNNNNKGKGKELATEEDEVSTSSYSEDDDAEEKDLGLADGAEQEQGPQEQTKEPQQALDVICGICLSESGNERGKLDCCEHFFCFGCIMEWAKVESRCPMCKQRFLTVARPLTSDGGARNRNSIFRIPTRDQVYEPSEEEIRLFTDPYQNTVCTECQEAGDEGLLLLCDRCDAAAHTYCVGLGRSVPRGDWFCQACHLLERDSSGEEDEEETIDAEEEGGSGQDSYLAMLVAEMQPNLFAGRTRRSAAGHGPRQLRRSTRRIGRRSSISDPRRLSEAGVMNMSATPGRGFFPGLENYGAARTLSRQRQVQASVHSRLQDMRENWSRLRSGEAQFSSVGNSVDSTRPPSEAGSFPSSSATRLGHAYRSGSATPMDVDIEVPTLSRGVGRSTDAGNLSRAWSNMERARRLEATAAGASHAGGSRAGASDRKNRDVKIRESPVSTRSRDKQMLEDSHSRGHGSSSLGERRSQGDFHSRANSSRDIPSNRHLSGEVPSKTNSGREGLDVFLNTRSSNSRDSGTKESSGQGTLAKEDKFPDTHADILSGTSDNCRGGYNLRDGLRHQISRTMNNTKENPTTGVRSPTLRESRNDSEVLQGRSILDDRDNSRGSGGAWTRRREAKELQALQGQSILDDKDNSRSSSGPKTRRLESKDTVLPGKGIFDDKDTSRGSTGPSTRRESERTRNQSLSQGRDQYATSRNSTRYEDLKLMKEQCYSLVQVALQPIFKKGKIDKHQYKELARSATHTLLSSLGVSGLQHGADVALVGTVTCDHEEPTSSSLIPGCCNTCVQRHVKKFVKALVKEKIALDMASL